MTRVTDFYNKLTQDLMNLYFPQVKYHRDNETSQKMTYQVELFNNGCLTYNKLIKSIAKLVNDTEKNIEIIVDKYLVVTE